MRAVQTMCWTGLALALVAGTPVALGQNGRRGDRREEQQTSAPAPSNDRRQRAEERAQAPSPAPVAQPRSSPQPAPAPAPAPVESSRPRYVAPPPAPAQVGGFDRRLRTAEPPPASLPQVNPSAPSLAPAPLPQTDRTRATPPIIPQAPLANNDRRRVRESAPPAPQAAPQIEMVRRGPAPQARDESRAGNRASIEGFRGSQVPVTDLAYGNGGRRESNLGPGRRSEGERDGRGYPSRTVVYPNRRPVEIVRPRSSVELSLVIGGGSYYRPRYERFYQPRVVCPPVVYYQTRHHWYRPVYSSFSVWDPWCEPRYVYSPYTVFPAPLWPGPSYTYASVNPYYSSGLGFSLFTYGRSSRFSGSFFYSTSTPIYTSTPFFADSTPWYTYSAPYSTTYATPPSSVETFRTDNSPTLAQIVDSQPLPSQTGTGAIRILSDSAPPSTPSATVPTSDAGFSSVRKPASVTIYRASDYGGTLAWNDSPTNIVAAVSHAAQDARAQAAGQFLGRSPAGGWEVTYEKWRRTAVGPELTCRAALPNESGSRATIILRLKDTSIDPVERLRAGQRLSISGFLTELSVDDPNHPGGLIVLEEGKMGQ